MFVQERAHLFRPGWDYSAAADIVLIDFEETVIFVHLQLLGCHRNRIQVPWLVGGKTGFLPVPLGRVDIPSGGNQFPAFVDACHAVKASFARGGRGLIAICGWNVLFHHIKVFTKVILTNMAVA